VFSKRVQSYINQITVEQEEIQCDEKLFCQQVDTAPLMIWMAGCNALYYYLNSSWLKFTGGCLTTGEFASERGDDIDNIWTCSVHPEDRQRCDNIYIEAFAAHDSFQRQYRLRRADGEYRWILDTAAPRFAADGSFVGYIGYCVDITEVTIVASQPILTESCLMSTNFSYCLCKIAEKTQAAEFQNTLEQLQVETAKRQAVEAQLHQKTLEFAAILQVLPDLYFRLNADGIILDYKPGLMKNLYIPGDCQGKSWRECLPTAVGDRFHQAITQALETQSIVSFKSSLSLSAENNNFEARFLPLPDQQIILLIRDTSDNIQALIEGDTKFRTIVENANDTTERKQAEKALQALAQREALLNRLSSQIRASLDLNHIVETAVQEIRNLFQIDRCAFLWYRQDADVPYWERVYEAKSSFLPCLLNEQATNAEIELIAAKTLNGEIIRINDIETVNDCTARQFMQDFGFTAFMSLPVHTQSGEIGTFSCGYCNGSRSWLDNEVELLQAVTVQLAIAIDQAKLYTQSRIAVQTAQDKAQQLEAAMLELQQTQAQLIQTEKMSSLGQLVAGVAHEINNPVNFIYGNISHASEYIKDLLHLVELYQQNYCPPIPEIHEQIYAIDLDFIKQDLPKILDSMNMGAERIRQIVLSLRNFSRLDEDGTKAVDIHEGLDSTLLLLQHRLKAKPGCPEIKVIRDYGNLPSIVCHAGQMNQVFMNLLANAIDVLEESFVISHLSLVNNTEQRTNDQAQMTFPQIRIRTFIQEDRVIVSVADNGLGMTEEVRKRLFDPFFTTKPVGKGTGMGLSISYQIVVKRHGGQIQCISAPGEGAEFVIMIPLK